MNTIKLIKRLMPVTVLTFIFSLLSLVSLPVFQHQGPWSTTLSFIQSAEAAGRFSGGGGGRSLGGGGRSLGGRSGGGSFQGRSPSRSSGFSSRSSSSRSSFSSNRSTGSSRSSSIRYSGKGSGSLSSRSSSGAGGSSRWGAPSGRFSAKDVKLDKDSRMSTGDRKLNRDSGKITTGDRKLNRDGSKTGSGDRAASLKDKQGNRQADRKDKQGDRQSNRQDKQADRKDRLDDRQANRKEAREDWQDHRNHAREDRQDFVEDMYDDYGYWGRYGWGRGGPYYGSGFFWGLTFGLAVASLPTYTQTVVYTGTTYYYAAGVYYKPAATGYVVVEAPVGIVVQAPPAECEVVMLEKEDKTYCYSRGSFYLFDEEKQGYVVVAAPDGAVVSAIPEDSEVKFRDGVKYHYFMDVYYRPHYFKNEYVYVVTKV